MTVLKQAFAENATQDEFDMDEVGRMTLKEFTRVVKRCVGPRQGVWTLKTLFSRLIDVRRLMNKSKNYLIKLIIMPNKSSAGMNSVHIFN